MPGKLLFGTGWRPDPPDERDFHLGHEKVREVLGRTGIPAAIAGKVARLLPPSVDLRKWCSPVQYQGYYNTCTAHVTAGMVELLENKAHGSYVPASRLFLYQVARRILGESGDPGVYLRQMMGTVALVGVPPEKYCPYLDTSIKKDPRLDDQPDAFLYAVAKDFGGAQYFRLDEIGAAADEILTRMRACLTAALPSSLGFTLYMSSLEAAAKSGEIPMPKEGEKPVGSHAVLVVGYDSSKKIGGNGVEETTGALLFKNSWGADWGEAGYGWLPYEYLTRNLAKDCWSITHARWIETNAFQLGFDKESS